jgi:hypothetical protein
MKEGTILLEAGIILKPSFCNLSLKLVMFENETTKDQQTYPTKLIETTVIITSAMNFLDLFLRCQEK